jgi:hypothetical protein
MELNKILKKERIKSYKEDIRLMTKKRLIQRFKATSSGKPKATLIIKNQIWQTYQWIKQGNEEPIEGNIRTYWYSHIKPTLARVGLLKGRHDHYQTMLSVFTELVRDYNLFRYADFGFDDDNWENRRIATKMPNVILFGEKAGWLRTLKAFYEEYGMTVAVLGGAPSLLSTEYLVKQLSQVTSLNQKFYLISAVDYDPSGEMIANSFVSQLKDQGLKDIELINLISLENYTKKEIRLFKFPIPSKNKTKVKNWIKSTNGINGKAFGLEADSMPRARYKKLVKETLKKLNFSKDINASVFQELWALSGS